MLFCDVGNSRHDPACAGSGVAGRSAAEASVRCDQTKPARVSPVAPRRTSRYMEPLRPNGITGRAREALTRILNHVLDDEWSLSAATRAYRARVSGPQLYSLHRLFDEQRRQLDYWLEQLFAQMRGAGLAMFGDFARRAADPAPRAADDCLEPQRLIGDLLERHEKLARALREDLAEVGEAEATELLQHLLEFHETSAWMLRLLRDGPGSAHA